jgi:hypothetical protein
VDGLLGARLLGNANLGAIFNSLLSVPLNRAELVDIHLAAVLDSPPCVVITTSLVEKGYEAGIWRARLGIKTLHADGLAATLSPAPG